MNLTNTACKNAKAKETPYKMPDGGGLNLLIHPNGSKYWRLRYRVHGKEKLMGLGVYDRPWIPQPVHDNALGRIGLSA